jgi:hypothetical protein
MKTKKEKWIVNGHIFNSIEEVNDYCVASFYRITEIEKIVKGNVYLVHVTNIN